MLVPEFLDFVIAENEATAIARRLNTPSRGWDGLLSVAQALVTRFQDLPENASTSPESFLDYAQVSPIVAAARIFDTFAAFEREEPLEERRDQCLHAAVCYAMYGNFPAATAVISRLNALEHATPGLLPIIAVCCPRLIGQCLNSSHVTDASVAFLTLLNSVLLGQLSSLHELESVLGACFDLCEDDFEQSLLLSSRVALRQVVQLATTPALRSVSIDDSVIRRVVADGMITLLPPQYKAITSGLITSTGNAFISLPTSAGKTLLGELSMLNCLTSGSGVVCFVAPYIAVGRQVASALRRHAPRDVEVCEFFGSFEPSALLSKLAANKLAIVATPERFDGLLRQSPDFARRLRCIVIDEAHLGSKPNKSVEVRIGY